MDNPRLRIDEYEVGLRKVGDNLYEPKNKKILLDCLTDSLNLKDHRSLFHVNELPEKCEEYKKIESFCFTTSINRISEAKILLKSLRQHHSQPIYIHCDQSSKLVIERLGYENLIIKPVINEKYLKNIVEMHTKDKYEILEQMHHCRSDYIFAKLVCLKQAMMKFKNTFFLDTDIIVLDDLQENFTEKLCLSPAFFAEESIHQGLEYGFYNAGYLFCEDRGFPQYWIDRFLNDSVFYEQECMNRFCNVYKFQTFPRSHNFGFWRGGAEVNSPKSLHVHITDEIKNEVKALPNSDNLFKTFRAKSLQIIKQKNPDLYFYINKLGDYKKYAFVHMAKCGGSYVEAYLTNVVLAPFIDHNQILQPHVEFNTEQISEIVDEANRRDLTENQWIRFHQNSVDLKTIEKLNDSGWETFTFLRDPRDLICSLYFFSSRKTAKTTITNGEVSYTNFLAMSPSSGIAGHGNSGEWDINDIDVRKLSLNDFIINIVENEKLHVYWKIPEYIEAVKYIDEMSHDNLGKFINKAIDPDHIYSPIPIGKNSSANKGYKFYCNNGDISKEAQRLIEDHPEYIKYSEYMKILP
jgi:hypothetical protein